MYRMILALAGLGVASVLYFFSIPYWFFPATVGWWLLFDTLNREGTTAASAASHPKSFLLLYAGLMIAGTLIEIVGNTVLGFWHYPKLSTISLMVSLPLFYPFILLSFREMYRFFDQRTRSEIAFIVSMFAGILIWEIPNLYSLDWVYTVPSPEVLGLDLVVILGWSILIATPLLVEKILEYAYGVDLDDDT